MIAGLTSAQKSVFADGLMDFQEIDSVKGGIAGTGSGLGPRFNAESCAQCHAAPAIGGSSPAVNPQMAAAIDAGATNSIPDFITTNGPVREARFPFQSDMKTPDGGVHQLFTISGRSDASGCTLAQPNFADAEAKGNLIFRIPTPTYGDGLIEEIPEFAILNNINANKSAKHSLGIGGRPNTSGNDGTVTRFGWKAQNKSLEVFTGEAYNVEMGVTNELFPNERSNPPAACLLNPTPEDATNFDEASYLILSDLVQFANFMRFLAPPAQSASGIPGNPPASSIQNGHAIFQQIHCNMCHTEALKTASSKLTPGLSGQNATLFSDLLVHNMGSGLADNVSQGSAGPDEFRTAPLWGLGQRIFFLHDGRSTPANGGLVHSIQQHASSGSEANSVINLYNSLSQQQRQDLLNFLRSL